MMEAEVVNWTQASTCYTALITRFIFGIKKKGAPGFRVRLGEN
jgi:hypothetical protein